ncbi:hypothetical protein JX266_006287 [Neoarthrinium moseri]|nr:hypothetical protein JX266_006287 [Neoarthrinium moseri]
MWSPLPVYSVPKGKRRNLPKGTPSKPPVSGVPATASSSGSAPNKLFQSFSELLDPAMDGPPSPERIRALTSQMRRTSLAETHQSHQTNSSGSSMMSTTSDRPSWEHGPENLTVSRRSSQRSISGGMPPRERPESVQIFGKTLFNRKGKLRRESSDQGSSNSSLHSAEVSTDPSSSTSKDQNFLNAVAGFTRRRTNTLDDGPQQRKLQISGPYNFQHLAHTEKDNVAGKSRVNRAEPAPVFSEIRYGRRPTDPSLRGIQADDMLANVHPGHYTLQQDPCAGFHASHDVELTARPDIERMRPQRASPPPVPMRSMKRTQSEDQIRVAPPRPPRSPTQQGFAPSIDPPPRKSSRGSVQHGGFNGLGTINVDQPITGFGLRQPKPIVWPALPETSAPFIDSAAAQQSLPGPSRRFSHAITTPDDAAWPLAVEPTATALPDVPEEEENQGVSRSRISVASNSSSLRGSMSVPLLRQITQSQAAPTVRPPSNASDTLGRFDLFAAQRALRASAEDSECEELPNETWEDDIDYCYEHEAEADCDYAWERPSCDFEREDIRDSHTLGHAALRYPSHGSGSTDLLSPPGQDDVPALSPVSQISDGTQQEAKTPTVSVLPVTSNFSLPRRDSSALLTRGHASKISGAENLKEYQEFNLSPSLLIPNDYHQQMLLYEREALREEDEDLYVAPLSPSGTHFAKSAMSLHARSSASTTDSMMSDQSGSSRHKSTTSTSTTLTRWTNSTACTIDGWQPSILEKDYAACNLEKFAVDPLPEMDESRFARDVSRERHSRAQSHADVLLVKSSSETTMAHHNKPMRETVGSRRRAKTTSRSHNQAPALALFPPVMENRI